MDEQWSENCNGTLVFTKGTCNRPRYYTIYIYSNLLSQVLFIPQLPFITVIVTYTIEDLIPVSIPIPIAFQPSSNPSYYDRLRGAEH